VDSANVFRSSRDYAESEIAHSAGVREERPWMGGPLPALIGVTGATGRARP